MKRSLSFLSLFTLLMVLLAACASQSVSLGAEQRSPTPLSARPSPSREMPSPQGGSSPSPWESTPRSPSHPTPTVEAADQAVVAATTDPDSMSDVLWHSPLGVAFGPFQENQNRDATAHLDGFVSYIHDLGIPRTKVSFYWSKLEPQPGQYDFHDLDAYLDQLSPNDQALLNVFTDGWCTTDEEVTSHKGAPLRDCPRGEASCTKHCDEYYREFVTRVAQEVRDHAHGGIRYMQRDTEPASSLHFPADQPEAFVELQHIYYQAVKSVLPDVLVIGVNHNGNFTRHDMGDPISVDFFDYVLQHGKDDFDLLDIRLYGDLYAIPHRVEWFRSRMQMYGYQKPIVSTEYGGVDPRTLHDGNTYVFWDQLQIIQADCRSQEGRDARGCVRKWAAKHPDQIHPKLRPFFGVASEEEQSQYEQLHCYDMVQRSLMALNEGVQALWWWNLQSPGIDLIFGQMRLRTPAMEELPGYACFQRFARLMGETTSVQRVDVDDPDIYLFLVQRSNASPMFVAWHREDGLDIYDAAAADPVAVSVPVPFSVATVTGALGEKKSVDVSDGMLKLTLSAEPIFIEAEEQMSIPKPVVTPRPLSQPTPTPVHAGGVETPQVGLSFIRFYFGHTAPFQPDTIFQDFVDSGVQLYRHLVKADLTWRNIEPRDNEWHFETADSVIFNSPLPFIATVFDYSYTSGTPPWCTDSSQFQKTFGPEAQDYLDHVLERYAPYVTYWEIGNEMEHWRAADPGDDGRGTKALPPCVPAGGFSPQEQGQFLAQVAQYIRERDPDAVIIMPGMIGLSRYSLDTWLAGVIEGGGSDWFDIVNYHYYGPWQRYPRLRAQLSTFLHSHGLADKPVWSTETGSTSSPTLTERTDYPNSPQTQAADVFRRLVSAWGAGDQLVLWHTYIGSKDNPENVWREYGLREANGSDKPALYSFRLLTTEVVPFRQVDTASADARGRNIYRVETETGTEKYVVWGEGTFTVPAGITQMTSVVPDETGHFTWQHVSPGQDIPLTEIPWLLKP